MKNISFDFSTSGRIIFGRDSLAKLSGLLESLGKNALIVKGKEYPDPKALYKLLAGADKTRTIFIVAEEPNAETIQEAVRVGRKNKCDFVIGFGGGAPVDAGKAVSALLNNSGELMDYLEVVGKGQPLEQRGVPYIAIPTTAGTGSEVTRNAVIAIPEKKIKVSMRDAYLLPTVSIVDPELTCSVPPAVTASTGMDAFTQVIEPYVTKISNPMVDMFCREAIPMAAKNLLEVYKNGADLVAREKMSFVSLLGGLSLANAKLGAVHGFAGPIGGMFKAPHGMICAALLPAVLKVNADLISRSAADHQKLSRFREIARWMTGSEKASIQDGIAWIANLADAMHIPGLADFGISKENFPSIIAKAKQSSSMKGNPVTLSEDQMGIILEMSL